MPYELIYTSVPRGLKPGSSGFCTVAATKGLPEPLREMLELLSACHRDKKLGDKSPPNFSLLLVNSGGLLYHVLSRVAPTRVDHQRRANHLAHHLAFTPEEAASLDPAFLLQASNVLYEDWQGEAQELERRTFATEFLPPQPCTEWQAVAGNAGWGGVLAYAAVERTFLNRAEDLNQTVIICPPETNGRSLVIESLRLIERRERWKASFCTYFTKLPPGVACRWRFVLQGSDEAHIASRMPKTIVIDLNERRKPALETVAEAGYIAAARAGQFAQRVPPAAVASVGGSAGGSPPGQGPVLDAAQLDRDVQAHVRATQLLLGDAVVAPPVIVAPGAQPGDRPARRLNAVVLGIVAASVLFLVIGGPIGYVVLTSGGPPPVSPEVQEKVRQKREEDRRAAQEREALAALHAEAVRREQEVADLIHQAAKLRDQGDRLVENWQQKDRHNFQTRQAHFEKLEGRFREQKDLAGRTGTLDELRQVQGELQTDIKTLQRDVASWEAEIAGLKAKCEELQKWCDQMSQDRPQNEIPGLLALDAKLNSLRERLKRATLGEALAADLKVPEATKKRLTQWQGKLAAERKQAQSKTRPETIVFADVQKIGGQCELPPPQKLTTAAERRDLCKILVDTPTDCELKLAGVPVGDQEFQLDKPEDSGSRRTWNVLLTRKNRRLAEDKPLAAFHLEKQTLSFVWLGNHGRSPDEQQLHNCSVTMTAGDQSGQLALRRAVVSDKVVFDLNSESVFLTDFQIPFFPRGAAVVLEPSSEGLPANNFKKTLPRIDITSVMKDGHKLSPKIIDPFRKPVPEDGFPTPKAGDRVVWGQFGGPHVQLRLVLGEIHAKGDVNPALVRLLVGGEFLPGTEARKRLSQAFEAPVTTTDWPFDAPAAAVDSAAVRTERAFTVLELRKYAQQLERERKRTDPKELEDEIRALESQYRTLLAQYKKKEEEMRGALAAGDRLRVRKLGEALTGLKTQSVRLYQEWNGYRRRLERLQEAGPADTKQDQQFVDDLLSALTNIRFVKGRIYAKYESHEVELARFSVQAQTRTAPELDPKEDQAALTQEEAGTKTMPKNDTPAAPRPAGDKPPEATAPREKPR